MIYSGVRSYGVLVRVAGEVRRALAMLKWWGASRRLREESCVDLGNVFTVRKNAVADIEISAALVARPPREA